MIRFYKSYLGRALLGLLILVELEKATDRQTVADQVRKWTPPDPTTAQTVELLLDNYIQGYPDETPTNDEVVKGAFGQLQKRKNDDADLLDLVVNALKLPFHSNFAGTALKALRDAVLTPSELTDLRKAYRTAAKCSCGHEFTSNEMVSTSVLGDTIAIRCTKCARPSIGRCDHCGQHVSLIGKIAASWQKEIDCGCRKKAERSAKVAVAPADGGGKTEHLRQLSGISAGQRLFYTGGKRSPATPIPTPASPLGGYIDYVAAINGPGAVIETPDDDGGF